MSADNRVGVIIHGCHLQAEQWERIEFGERNLSGRVTTGIEEAVNKKAVLIFWGTGASQNGRKESEHTYEMALGPKLKELAQRVNKEPEELAAYLKQVSVVDIKSQNTSQEIEAAISISLERNINELILVSSPTHIARCHQEALKIKEKMTSLRLKIYATASDTCFANSTASSIVVVEPQHRGDMPKVPFHVSVAKIFQFLKTPRLAFEFNDAFERLIAEYKEKQSKELEAR